MLFSVLAGRWQRCCSAYGSPVVKAALQTKNFWDPQYKPAGIFVISSVRDGRKFVLSAALHDLHKHRSPSILPRTPTDQHAAPTRNAAPPVLATANITMQPLHCLPKPLQQFSTTPQLLIRRPPTQSQSPTSSFSAQRPPPIPQAATAVTQARSAAPPPLHTMTAGPATPASSPATPNPPPRNEPHQPQPQAKRAKKPT